MCGKTVIINGEKRDVQSPCGYDDVVKAALGEAVETSAAIWTVTYRAIAYFGEHDHDGLPYAGSLTPGEELYLHDGMVFGVVDTGRA